MELLAELHKRIVHFPIAFFFLYFFLETFGIILKKDYLQKTAFIVLSAGVAAALFSALTGNQSYEIVKPLLKTNEFIISQIEKHEQYATITLWYFTVVLFFRIYLLIKKKFDSNLKYILILLGLIGCYLIYITGIYGGSLVYKYGIGTEFFIK